MRSGLMTVLLACVAGCAATHATMGGATRPPLLPSMVIVYSHEPPVFDQIAVLDASTRSLFNPGGQRTTDKVIERLKAEAARLGANGLILEGFDQTQTGSIGTGVGSESYSAHGSLGVGVGGAVGIFKTTGRGRAIFVPRT